MSALLDQLAEQLDAAEATKTTLTAEQRAVHTPNRAEGYAIQKTRFNKWDSVPYVWKIGGSNHASQQLFKMTEPFAGPVRAEYCREIAEQETVIDFPVSHSGLAEVEVAVKLAKDVTAENLGDVTNDYFASIHLAIELPAARVGFKPDSETYGWLIADNSTSGSFVMGKAFPVGAQDTDNLSAFGAHHFRCFADGEQVAESKGDALVQDPLTIAREMLVPIIAQCGTLKAGAIISTGGITAGVDVSGAKEIRAEWEGVDSLTLKRT